jgi:sigma-B regulation protein RsbU (phosphoserine phosphatase)
VLSRANDVVRRQLASDKFITVIYGVIDVHTGAVVVGSAGHPGPVLIHGGGAEAVELPGNPPLGVVDGHDFAVKELTLAPGDTLLLFTDGCIDAGPHQASFGTDRVVAAVSVPHDGPRETAEAVLEAATRFAGGTLSDDVAVVGVRFAGRDD